MGCGITVIMKKAGEILNEQGRTPEHATAEAMPAKPISKRLGNKIKALSEIREMRERRDHEWGTTTHPFVLCSFPVSPMRGIAEYVRKNGKHTLRVLGSVEYGLPWGMDRLIPIWIITEVRRTDSRVIHFKNIQQILDMFGLVNNGRNHRRIQDGFRRILSARIIWEQDDEASSQAEQPSVFRAKAFQFIDELQLVDHKKHNNPDQLALPDLPDMMNDNVVIVSEQLYGQIKKSPIPIDLRVVGALTDSPSAMDLFIWLSFRCNSAKGSTRIPLFGEGGLQAQFGIPEGTQPKTFKQYLKRWLGPIKAVWPDCPVQIVGDYLVVNHGAFIRPADTKVLPGATTRV
jgi:hypothetical protein